MMNRLRRPVLRNVLFLSLFAAALAIGARARAGDLPPSALVGKLEWRSIGPYIGGRVVAVAGVPQDPNLFYMGGVDAGIWRSTDYGIHWENISDGKLSEAGGSIGAVAVAPSDPNVIYAGTGESDIRGDMITGDGVYKSTDAGKTWQHVGLADTHTVSAITVDPKNPDVVYVSSMGHVFAPNPDRGVFKSIDGGKTWRKVLFLNDETGVIDLVMDPNDASVLYAAAWQAYRTPWKLSSGGPGSGLYKSTDGGEHWADISKNPGMPKGVLGRIGVAIAASHPETLYTIEQADEGGVFRSDDAGKTWKRVNDDWSLRQRAFYYMSIFVDPKDPHTVYVPEVDALWVSRDGAKTFKKLRTPHGDNHIVWINPNDTRILLEGNDGGATVSTDGGKTWSTEHNQPTGQFYHVNIDNQFPYHVYGAQQDEGSFEGPSASGSKSIDLGDWHRVAYGESTFVVPQPGDPNVTYGSGYFSIFLRYDRKTDQYQSVSPWPRYREGSASRELEYRFGWTHPILFSPADPNQLLIAAQCVLESRDHGRTWRRISPDLTRNDPATEEPTGGPINLDQSGAEIYPGISSLAVSPLDGNVIWAGSDDGLVHVTTDGGQNWKAVRPPDLPERSNVTSIEPSHFENGTAYLTASRYMWDDFKPYVYKTSDYGRTWKAIAGGLPQDQYAFVIRQDPGDASLMFLGAKSTVYVSFDGGGRWEPLALNLPHVQVRDLAIDRRQGEVVAATHGRAFWLLPDLALLEQMTKNPAVDGGAAALFAPETAWLSHAYGQPPAEYKPPDVGANPRFGATVYFHVSENFDGKTPARLEFTDGQGKIIRSFDLHLKTKEEIERENQEKNATERAEEPPWRRKAEALEKLTAIEPGMNRFQWNLRYPDAADVKGFYTPIAAGGLDDDVNGPVVNPGTYDVILDYGGAKSRQSFKVALDPRISASPEDLAARLDLELKIHAALDTLDRTINRAIEARDALKSIASARGRRAERARKAAAALEGEIEDLVQMELHSSEGPLLHEAKLRSHLAYLAAEINLAYASPTPAEIEVLGKLDEEARAGEKRLEAAIAAARKIR
jgi:photosystem II stability/assembly factor-like uncharacterized protein